MENKRQFFRIHFYDVPVHLNHGGLTYHGRMRDLGGNGISFYLQEKIDFETCPLSFELEEQSYTIMGTFIRREYTRFGEYLYACSFPDLDEKERSKLMSTLLKLDAIRRKK